MRFFKIMFYHFNLDISRGKINLTIMARINVTQSFFSFVFYSKTYELDFHFCGCLSFDLLLLYFRCRFFSTYRNSCLNSYVQQEGEHSGLHMGLFHIYFVCEVLLVREKWNCVKIS